MKSLVFIGFFAFFLIFLTGCSAGLGELGTLQPADTTGVERAREVQLLYSDSAVVRAKILAPTLLYKLDAKNPEREFPDGMRVFFFDENAEPTSQLSAQYAVQSERDKKVTLRDSVVVWNNRRERLQTPELIWSEVSQTISSSKSVTITTPNERITGYHFRAKMDFSDWEIDSVTGRIRSNNLLDAPM